MTTLPKESSENGVTVFRRLYSADPVNEIRIKGAENASWSNDLGEYNISRSGSTLIIKKQGIAYTVASSAYTSSPAETHSAEYYTYPYWNQLAYRYAWSGPIYADPSQLTKPAPSVIYDQYSRIYYYHYSNETTTVAISTQRVTRIDGQNGKQLTLNYDGNLNLTTVTDNRNNKLTFEHNYKSSIFSSQTFEESQLITAVTLSSGTKIANGVATADIDTQRAEFDYKSYAALGPRTRVKFNLYALTASRSPIAGDYTYTSQLTMNGALPSYVRTMQADFSTSGTTDADYYYPILTQVINSASQVEQQWNITQNYQVNTYGTYTTAQTTLTSYKPGGNGVADALKTTTVYDDLAKTIKMTTSPDGTATATTNITTVVNSANDITINASGYPCLTSNGKPVSSVHVTTDRSHISDVTDARGIKTAYTYDTRNRVTSVTEAVGLAEQRATTYTYGNLEGGSLNIFTVPNTVNSPEVAITNTLNARGQIIAQKVGSPLAGSVEKTVSYTYYEDATLSNYGLLQNYVGPRHTAAFADKIRYAYDSYGNLSSKAQEVNGVDRNTAYQNYNSAGQPNLTINPDGTRTQVTYDSTYRITDSTYGTWNGTAVVGEKTHNEYNTLGQLTSTTNPRNEKTNYAYDAIGRLRTTTYANGNLEINYYFPNGQINAVGHHGADGALVQSEWQMLNNDTGWVSFKRNGGADKNWLKIYYDANGNVLNTQTAQGITESWTYDALGRIKTHTDGNGNVDKKEYLELKADGHILDTLNETRTSAANATSINGAGSERWFKNGNVLRAEDNDDFGKKEYFHNEADQITLQRHENIRDCYFNNRDQLARPQNMDCIATAGFNATDPNLRVIEQYNYDQSAFDRLDSVISNTQGANPVAGKKIGVDTSYTYDVYGSVTSKTQTNNTPIKWGYPASQLKVKYTYNRGRQLRLIYYPSGNLVWYTYKPNGERSNIVLNGKLLMGKLSYDGASRLRSWYWGTGNAKTQIDRDDAGLTTQIYYDDGTGNTSNFKEVYSYDNDGRMIKRQFTGTDSTDSGIFGYAYDNNSQIVNESRVNNGSIGYVYDKNGNRSKVQLSFPLLFNDYDWYGDYLKYDGNRLLEWRRGNDDIPLRMKYYQTGELQETPLTKDQTGNSSNYLLTSTATYDYAGRRRAEGAVPNSTKYTGMFMDYNHKNERTFRGGSNIDRQYAYDEASHLIGEYTASGAMIVEYIWMDDKPVAAVFPNNRIVYLITDWQNKPRLGIDAVTKRNVWQWNPKAFGWPNASSNDYAITINLRFPGQYYDEQSGLYYNHNRYYNPRLGRYMEPDPIGLEGGLNPYSYAGNNPVMNIDETGAIWVNVFTGAVGAVTSGAGSAIMQYTLHGKVDLRDVGIATGVGAVAGFLSPWTALTPVGAIATGSAANIAQTGIGHMLGKPTTGFDYALSALVGGLGGKFGGTISRPNSSLKMDVFSPWINKSVAQSVNTFRDVAPNATSRGLFNGMAGGLTSSIDKDGISATQKFLNNTIFNFDSAQRQNEFLDYFNPTITITATKENYY